VHETDAPFAAAGRDLVDWLAGYLGRLAELPVAPTTAPGDLLAALPTRAPELGDPRIEPLIADLDALIVPHLVHWQSPRFMGYFPANASTPSILADLVSSTFGTIGLLWASSPAVTELEVRMLDWMADLLDLPAAFHSTTEGGGVIQGSASAAVLVALVAARERATGGRSNRAGLGATADHPLVAYIGDQTHSSVEKGARIAGIGSDNIRRIPTDDADAMRVDLLEAAVAEDLAAGRRPFFVCATVGTTSSLGIDPVERIGRIARAHDLWLHVDAAMLGIAAICPELRPAITAGAEAADSWNTNASKWMGVNFDCSLFWVRDRRALTEALAIDPAYLDNAASRSGAVVDYRDWEISLGRRFRALKLWFTLRWFGADGIRAMIRRHADLTRQAADLIAADDRFELVRPPRTPLVVFRLRGDDAGNAALVERVNRSGRAFVSTTVLDERLVIRLPVAGLRTEAVDVEEVWATIVAAIP
jgi:aromatic-L-amino-acid decarboxylase